MRLRKNSTTGLTRAAYCETSRCSARRSRSSHAGCGRNDVIQVAAFLCVASSFGCGELGSGGQGEESSTLAFGQSEKALGIPTDWWQPWPTGIVPYCYQPSAPASGYPQPGTASYNQSRQMAEDAIAKYEAIPNAFIDFRGGGLCQDWDDYMLGTDPDTLRIVITDDDAATRFCDSASIAQGERVDDACTGGDEIVVVFGEGYWAPEAGILHELGHALAFNHEYWRRPGSEDDCDPEATTAASNGITAYDVYSVMNATYCHTRTVLSGLDSTGLAFVYPGSGADDLAVPHSFRLPTAIVTGSNDNAAIEFAQRTAGVEGHHYAQAQWRRSTSPGSLLVATGSSVSIGTALGSASQAAIRATFTDGFGRVRTTPTRVIRQDPGLATALILGATSAS